MQFRPKTGWTSLILIACLMLSVAWSIALAQPGPAVGLLSFVVLGAVLAGALMGGLDWLPAGIAHVSSMGAGAIWTAFLVGGRLQEFPSAPADALATVGRLDRMALVRDWYRAYVAAHPYPAEALPGLPLGPADAGDLMYFFFLVTMALLMWLLAYICTWFVVRYLSWWGAVLPSGFALVFNLTNSPRHESHSWYLAFFLFCAFLLAAQVFSAVQVEQWRERHLGFSLDLPYELLRDAVLLALICLGLAALMPDSLGMQPLQRSLRELARSPRRAVSQQIRSWFPSLVGAGRGEGNSFGETMSLGGSIDLGDTPVFELSIAEGLPPPPYYRQAVFDRYDGRSWQRQADQQQTLPADRPLSERPALTVPITQTYRTLMPQTRQLYAAPQAERVSLELNITQALGEALTLESTASLPLGSSYTVVSDVSAADPGSLADAPQEGADPADLFERYTQLPAALPGRVRTLAEGWVQEAGAQDRFAMAAALEARLREHIVYSEQIDTPPAGRDRVDWVLFEGRRGYCDYYASSFVVMARSLGIPARMAAGYALGSPRGDGSYLITASNAHAWPEVYFPSYGWIPFEPTGGGGIGPIARAEEPGELPGASATGEEDRPQREVQRPEEEGPSEDPAGAGAAPDETGSAAAPSGSGFQVPWRLLGGLAGLLAMAWLLQWAWLERPLRGLGPAAGAFARLSRLARWLGLGRRPADTPAEFEARLQRAFPQGQGDVSTIVEGFARERYGRAEASSGGALERAWRQARAALLRASGRLTWRRWRRRA